MRINEIAYIAQLILHLITLLILMASISKSAKQNLSCGSIVIGA